MSQLNSPGFVLQDFSPEPTIAGLSPLTLKEQFTPKVHFSHYVLLPVLTSGKLKIWECLLGSVSDLGASGD